VSVETVGAVTSPPPPAAPVKPEASAEATAATATSSVESIKPTVGTKVDAAKAKPSAKNNTSTKAANTQSSNQHRSSRGDDSFTVGGFTISGTNGGQLTKLINRPEVKSILAQYGLN
jgi:hypothetical protein